MRFRLLEAPALSARSWKDKPQSALGSTSRSKKSEAPTENPEKSNTFVPQTSEEWEEVLYNKDADRAFREIACVKWIENNRPSSPLLSLLGLVRSKLAEFDAKVKDAQTNMDIGDDSKKFKDSNDDEWKQDKVARAQSKAVEQRELDNLKKQTEAIRSKLQAIFTAIFIAIDCKSDLFENVITKLNLKQLPETYYGNLVTLANTVAEDAEFDTEQKYLYNLSLYNRPVQEFKYTLNVFSVVHSPTKVVNYYDPKKINLDQLYDGKDIKPAGISKKDPDDFNTIYGVLEAWKTTAPNENTDKPVKSTAKKSETEFSSFEEAEKEDLNKDGAVIKINGKFKFNGDKKKWEPVEK